MTFMGGVAVVGQWCSATMLYEFNASIFLAFLNVRMAASFVLSTVIYGHHTSLLQIWALSIIGFALVFRSAVSFTSWWAEESATDENEPLVKGNSKKETRAQWAQRVTKPLNRISRHLGNCCFPMMRSM